MLGKRIRLFRSRKGLKQKELGEMVGFMGKTSDVRIAQYETEARTPKDDLIKQLADIFGVTPRAITVPNIDSYLGLMHTFFALEDEYGFKISTDKNGLPCITLDEKHLLGAISLSIRRLYTPILSIVSVPNTPNETAISPPPFADMPSIYASK